MSRFDRTEKLIGAEKLALLGKKSVLIVGLGGVGGYAFEMLIRGGIGRFVIVDGDRVDETNINRQILATDDTVDKYKVDVAAERAALINGKAEIIPLKFRYDENTSEEIFSLGPFDYCIDCFDSVKDKIFFLSECARRRIKTISACGAGNRTAPEFKTANILKTHSDPLAKAVRKGLRDVDATLIKAVFDAREPVGLAGTPASISYAPALMGCTIGAEVIKDFLSGG